MAPALSASLLKTPWPVPARDQDDPSCDLIERIEAHDRYQIELKREFAPPRGARARYELTTYLFLPHTLGVGSNTYSKDDFYRDLQSYVRLRTPELDADGILDRAESPLAELERLSKGPAAERGEQAVFQLKLLYQVTRRALAELAGAEKPSDEEGVADFISRSTGLLHFCERLLGRYRALGDALGADAASEETASAYRLIDEGLSLLTHQALLRRHESLARPESADETRKLRAKIRKIAWREQERRQHLLDQPGAAATGEPELLERLSLLKKYSSEVLYLDTERRPEGKSVEHPTLAVAAGVAMAFATALAFFSQRELSSYSVELFAAFVCGYMFKDRIKEVVRAWLAEQLSRKLDDHRIVVRRRGRQRRLGYVRERVRFVDIQDVAPQALELRARASDPLLEDRRREVVLAHRRELVLDPEQIQAAGAKAGAYGLTGIERLDIRALLRKMDDPRERRRKLSGETVETIRCRRTYPVYVITTVRSSRDGKPSTLSAVRVVLSRKGINRIEPLR